MEATLLHSGYSWSQIPDELDWWQAYCLLSTAAYDSPISRAVNPKDWYWGHPLTDALVTVVDELNLMLSVMEHRPKVKKSDLPKPIPRPWDKQKHAKKISGKPRPIAEVQRLLGW